MKFDGPLIVVSNMERSKAFYHEVLGLEVILDFGANITLTGGLFLQTKASWCKFTNKGETEIINKNHAGELYFEEECFDHFIERLGQRTDISYVHPVIEQSWGQRGVRFYDPDLHVSEVGEEMGSVIRRFIDGGLSIEETARRMNVPVGYVQGYLSK